MKAILIILPFILTSCASYMNSLYSELDQGRGTSKSSRSNKFDLYRKKNQQNPSTQSQNQLLPGVERDYQPQEQTRKRYKAQDLVDSQGDGSLWGAEHERNYLFSNQKTRRSGDIVLINILSKFKNEITSELRRTFPTAASVNKDKPAGSTAPSAVAAAPQPGPENAPAAVVHDRISAVIIEEINKDHLLIKGRKNLLFKNKKRIVEIQALVFKRDISDDDSVSSDNFLESTINILR